MIMGLTLPPTAFWKCTLKKNQFALHSSLYGHFYALALPLMMNINTVYTVYIYSLALPDAKQTSPSYKCKYHLLVLNLYHRLRRAHRNAVLEVIWRLFSVIPGLWLCSGKKGEERGWVMPVKRRDRRGLIPSSCAKIAQPHVALRDCRQY